ncbi:hypothetical protein [uncultured Sphaerochaeta sp.]|uniref:hypothetical protein n=1 Tax=uncultured Sphaerochaeta sp. TaxID=886478 RepID=UPI0029CA512E|nr:hypothetical protein [uncultured Sphaerochaeta sp.]
MFALVVTFLTGRKLGSVNAVNRGVAGDVPAELDRARCSVEGSAGHAEHSTESIAAVLRNLGASEAAGNRSLDGISESRGISERIQKNSIVKTTQSYLNWQDEVNKQMKGMKTRGLQQSWKQSEQPRRISGTW